MNRVEKITYIKPGGHFASIDLQEHWQARYMFMMLVWKKVRASFGDMYFWFIWVCARPLIYVIIFSLFKHWSQARTGVELPYALYIYSGLILWYYFLETAIEVSTNIKANAALVTKIYLPRMITPTVPLLANLVDLGISTIPLILMMFYFGIYPGWQIIMIIPTLLVVMVTAMGTGLIIAAITLRLRDFQRVFEFSLYIGMFVSPVIFSPRMIPGTFHWIYNINPMVGALIGWREALFGADFPWASWIYSCSFALVAFSVGLYLYLKFEHEMIEAI